jgi:hypothetical protein
MRAQKISRIFMAEEYLIGLLLCQLNGISADCEWQPENLRKGELCVHMVVPSQERRGGRASSKYREATFKSADAATPPVPGED